jgi:hypothetical protein
MNANQDESSEEIEMAPLEVGRRNDLEDPQAAQSQSASKKRGRKKI